MRSASNQPNGTGVTSSTNDDKFKALVSDALPLLRVYMTWLCMYRSDIVQFETHLQPYVVQMYKSLSAVLSSLFEVLRHYPRLEPVPYLFTEDMEAFGLKALNGPAIPPACLLGIDSITRTPKLRPEGVGKQIFKPDDVSFTRVLDITTCGFALADDAEFPLAITQMETSDGHHVVKAVYLAEGKPASPTATASKVAATYASPTTAAAELSAVLGVRPSPMVAAAELAPRSVSANTPNLASGINGFAEAVTLHGGQQVPLSAGTAVSPYPPQLAEESNYAVDHDSRMNDLVNGLVEPSESDASEAVLGQNDSSYGMHTATARDVFASALPSTSPGLTANRNGLPSLPWSWGSVAQPTSHQRGISSGSPRDGWPGPAAPAQPLSNRSSTSGVPQYGMAHANNPFAAGTNAQSENSYQALTESVTSSTQGIWRHGRQHSGNQAASTTAGVSGQTSYGNAPNTNNPWSRGSSKFSSIEDILGAQLGALVQGPAGGRPMVSTPAPISPAVPSSFASTNFSANTSSLPPVNSPWGVPNRPAAGSTKPGPIARPPGLNANSRSNSNGNGSPIVHLLSGHQRPQD